MYFCKNSATVASLEKKKSGILSVFLKAKQELSELLDEQKAASEKLHEQIESLSSEMGKNEDSITNTQSLLSKIDNFLK